MFYSLPQDILMALVCLPTSFENIAIPRQAVCTPGTQAHVHEGSLRCPINTYIASSKAVTKSASIIVNVKETSERKRYNTAETVVPAKYHLFPSRSSLVHPSDNNLPYEPAYKYEARHQLD